MQTFRTRFTTDISQHKQAMRQFRSQTGDAIDRVRNQLMALGTFSIGGMGLLEAGKSVLSLAGDMEKTKVAFSVMLGNAEKAKRVLGDLTLFADITPFDTAEIIAAGRSLLACGVATDKLSNCLDLLGNIAAGTNMTISDMVAIYAKMANKGKVQTEELNQMAERGIPIYRTLCTMLKINQSELSVMAEKGQLSFGLIEEALEKLGGKGGQYFGLIAQQSRTMSGLFSTLQGNISMLATEFGELLIPELSAYLSDLTARLEEMKTSGELSGYMRQLADSLKSVLKGIVELAAFIAENKDVLYSAGKIITIYYAWTKVNSALATTGKLLSFLGKADFSPRALRSWSAAVKYLTADLRALSRLQGNLVTSLGAIAAAGATAFAGWEIGKAIGQMLELDKVFTKMLLKAQGMSDVEIEKQLSDRNSQKTRPSVTGPDLAANAVRKKKLEKEIRETKKTDEAEKKKKELQTIEQAEKEYEQKIKDAAKRREELTDHIRNNQNKLNTLIAEREKTSSHIYTRHTVVKNPEYERLEKEIKEIGKANLKLNDERNSIIASQKQYAAQKKAAAEVVAREEESARKKISEAEKLKAAKEKEASEKKLKQQQALARKEQEISSERKQIAKDLQLLADEQFRDKMSEKISGWQKGIEKYQKQIDETEQKLQRFGASVSGDILKTSAEIAQERKDEILRKKIASHNEGKVVHFSEGEKKRIVQLQSEQAKARIALSSIEKDKSNIRHTENRIDALDQLRKKQDWKDRSASLTARARTVAAAQNTMNRINDGKKPVQSYLDMISALLTSRLPERTV